MFLVFKRCQANNVTTSNHNMKQNHHYYLKLYPKYFLELHKKPTVFLQFTKINQKSFSGIYQVRNMTGSFFLPQVKRNTSSSSEDGHRCVPVSARDYVESLHQNSRATLLYGKNNVLVQPVSELPRYTQLMLHSVTAIARRTVTRFLHVETA